VVVTWFLLIQMCAPVQAVLSFVCLARVVHSCWTSAPVMISLCCQLNTGDREVADGSRRPSISESSVKNWVKIVSNCEMKFCTQT
jgi:hypothetical protein